MSGRGRIVVLDTLLENLTVEHETAASRGWKLEGWNGEDGPLADAEIVLHVRTVIDAKIFDLLTKCRVIGRFGTGLDTVDLDLARRRRIEVVNVRDYCIPELSAHTLGLIFALTRGIWASGGSASAMGSWQSDVLSREVSSIETIGVVGLGAIGRTVCAGCTAIGSRVIAASSKDAETVRALGATKVDLLDLLTDADVVSLHVPLVAETARMIGANELEAMRDTAMLVNTARIGLIDERAVADALLEGRLGGLGLDARLGAESPIAQLGREHRVLVTPHLGWYSDRSASLLRRQTVSRSIDAFERLDSDQGPIDTGRTT